VHAYLKLTIQIYQTLAKVWKRSGNNQKFKYLGIYNIITQEVFTKKDLFKLLKIWTYKFVQKIKNISLKQLRLYIKCCLLVGMARFPLVGMACCQLVGMAGLLWGRVLPHTVVQSVADWGKLDSQDMAEVHQKACMASPHLKNHN
jgi:hypothetical protein